MNNTARRTRRSHLHRRAPDKGVVVTDNDIRDIFEPLTRYAQLSTRQLVAFGRRHPIVTKARLGELWHATEGRRAHWLHRASEDMLFANHLHVDDLHRLGSEAEALLSARGMVPPEEWVARSRIGGTSTAPSRLIRLAHDHMACDVTLDIELGARQAGIPFFSHIDLIVKAPASTRAMRKPLRIPLMLGGCETVVEPDALFAVGERTYALEADTGTESIKAVIVPKILAYREIVAAGVIDAHFGIDNLTVLFVTVSQPRMRAIMVELAAIARHGRSTMFGFRAKSAYSTFLRTLAPSGRLLSAPWQRVGHDELSLVKAAEAQNG